MRVLGASRRTWILGLVGLVVAIIVGILVGSAGDETPAPPAVLNRIADKNEDAATEAAARMKADSEQATRAADARLEANEMRAEAVEQANGQSGQ